MMKHSKIDEVRKNPTEWAMNASIEELLELIKQSSEAYYNSENVILEDDEFDKLIEIYNLRSPKKYDQIGAKISEKNKCELPYHMGSMNKTKLLSELGKWLINQGYNDVDYFIITPKIDGTSALVIVEIFGGSLNISIFTRGDGDTGKKITFLEDILIDSETKKLIETYMKKNKLQKLVLRGEMIVSKENFKEFSSNFKCPRSMVNGITNKKIKEQKDTNALNSLDFVVFEVIEPKLNPEEQFKLARSLELNCVEWHKIGIKEFVSKIKGDILDSLPGKILSEYRKSYKYDIDGIIISSNIEYDLPKEGNPEYSLAFKINQNGVVTTIKEVEWNISKHGVLKPKLIFDKIKLGTSDVEKCTGFNGSFIFNNSLGPGAKIRVVLSGEIIPYITEIVEQANIPSMPTCGYKWNDTKVDCIILNDTDELVKKKIVTFIKTIEIDYLAEGLVNHLFQNGFKTLKSILTISKEDLLKLERIDEKMATKLVNSIKSKIDTPLRLESIMDGSLCFGNGFGIKRCKQIVDNFPDFIYNLPSHDSLIMLPGWSDKSIKKFNDGMVSFTEFLSENSYIKFKKHDIENKTLQTTNSKFKKICITGKRDKDIIKYIKDNGIDLVNSVTREVDLLICEDINSSSGKITTAKKRGIEILDLDTFKTTYVFV